VHIANLLLMDPLKAPLIDSVIQLHTPDGQQLQENMVMHHCSPATQYTLPIAF